MDRVTADSNIYVSALKFGGKPLTLLEMALEGDIELAVSDSIVRETLGILKGKFRRTPEELLADEAAIGACTKRVRPSEILTAVPRDPDDNHVLECARSQRVRRSSSRATSICSKWGASEGSRSSR